MPTSAMASIIMRSYLSSLNGTAHGHRGQRKMEHCPLSRDQTSYERLPAGCAAQKFRPDLQCR